nr:unnamed protein product [Callosobruchus chinensis]
MGCSNAENFWTSGSSLVFNFDDDDEVLHEPVDFIFKSSEDSCVLPIHSFISKTCLDFASAKPNKRDILPIEVTIQRLLKGQKSSLFDYRNLKDKISLLEAALNSKDGNIILMVVLFLKQTLKRNIFFLQLSKWKPAVKHYAYHLIISNQYQELADLYMATGATSNMKQLFYLIGKDVTAKDILYKRLEHAFMEHLQNFVKHDVKVELCDSMQFLKWQIDQKETAVSVVEQLALLCKKELDKKNETFNAIGEFKEQFKLMNWLTKKKMFKTAIPADIFVYGLSKHSPPKEVLEEYLIYTASIERRLQVAQKLGCHKFIIHHYINQKDKAALMAYKEKVRPRSEEYFLIESALYALVR